MTQNRANLEISEDGKSLKVENTEQGKKILEMAARRLKGLQKLLLNQITE